MSIVHEAGAGVAVSPRRERLRAATRAEIKAAALRRMAVEGAGALSLRAIARDMGLTAPALYRYYPSRDDLITALILDAYHAMADTLEAARDAWSTEDHRGRILASLLAYRDWAVAHPREFVLIAGTPIPGYHAPAETLPAARRSMRLFLGLIERAWHGGALVLPPEYAHPPAELAGRLARFVEETGHDLPPAALQLTLVTWAKLTGLVSLELFGHFGPILGDSADFYRFEAEAMLDRLGLRHT